jgi:hypothetical protein
VHTVAKTLIIAAAALAAAGSALFVTGKRVPELTAPIKLGEVYALADGGSLHLVVKDKQGREFLLGVRGSLEVPRSEFPVYVQRWYPWVSFPITLSPRSTDERALLNALNGWVQGADPASQETLALGQVQAILKERNAMSPPPNR